MFKKQNETVSPVISRHKGGEARDAEIFWRCMQAPSFIDIPAGWILYVL